ncbi:Conserved hypothetical protein [Clostridium acetobutylicum EA 2018]|uniref:Uncharacterized protein n=1 Tax=Clostridium acetobutylicum (strain ATCC 824 / DSM 792 / JCM 1419 / IAM 19013 / LMG 5710 / NBRC 13948 / NRRL B-527 / VKM B-1787 / 2291 / W) TaxID=272562 RepID=Q97FN0_CLOAB|nr:Hypothetical protein CA_C2698 [Clostridium acetobutylicum ATCC 824]ADZ21744.1 Conserved hypothetical protein [Clostridium acetobutylicum EA 2018]AEI32507.1 hypothetical protein SMB_G2733 [Clostridium acetobutylicum DSM 1731]
MDCPAFIIHFTKHFLSHEMRRVCKKKQCKTNSNT